MRVRRIPGTRALVLLTTGCAFLGSADLTLSSEVESALADFLLLGFLGDLTDLLVRRFTGLLEAVFFEAFLAFGDRGFLSFIPKSAEVVGCGSLNSGEQVTTAVHAAQPGIWWMQLQQGFASGLSSIAADRNIRAPQKKCGPGDAAWFTSSEPAAPSHPGRNKVDQLSGTS